MTVHQDGPRLGRSTTPRRNLAWQDRAACRGMDLALFFGEEGETRPEREAREALAKELCGWCKVRADCLTDALREPGQFGVWGGLTAEERTAARPGILRRKRGAA